MIRIIKKVSPLVALLLIQNISFGQTSTTTAHAQQLWTAYANQTRISDRWGLWLEAQLRTQDEYTKNFSQSIIRPGVTYYLNNNSKFTLGYAFVNHFPADGHSDISRPEHRIWQQFQWHTPYKTVRTMQWLRLEERYLHKLKDGKLADGYSFGLRTRYNFMLQVPLNKKAFAPHTLAAHFNNELMVNLDKKVVYNYFDQNRLFVGLAYHNNAHDNIQLGYLNIFQQLAAGNAYKITHAIRLSYFHNVDLRKK